jgi:hypothetical protein
MVKREGFTKIDHFTMGKMFSSNLTASQYKVLLFAIRMTAGYQQTANELGITRIMKGFKNNRGQLVIPGTGLSRRSVITALRRLIEKGVLTIVKRGNFQGRANVYRVNPATDWTTSVMGCPSELDDTRLVQAKTLGGAEDCTRPSIPVTPATTPLKITKDNNLKKTSKETLALLPPVPPTATTKENGGVIRVTLPEPQGAQPPETPAPMKRELNERGNKNEVTVQVDITEKPQFMSGKESVVLWRKLIHQVPRNYLNGPVMRLLKRDDYSVLIRYDRNEVKLVSTSPTFLAEAEKLYPAVFQVVREVIGNRGELTITGK